MGGNKVSPFFFGDLGVLVKGGSLVMHVLPGKLILPMPPRLAGNQKSRALKTLHVVLIGRYDKVCEDLVLQTITNRPWHLLPSRIVDRHAIT